SARPERGSSGGVLPQWFQSGIERKIPNNGDDFRGAGFACLIDATMKTVEAQGRMALFRFLQKEIKAISNGGKSEAWNQSKRLSTGTENSSYKEEELQRSCLVKPMFRFCSEIQAEIKGFGVGPRVRVPTRLVTGDEACCR
ncbi:hypothetical protein U1Q18_017202, partial [Sarracenia purpurea var. burkii]